MTQYHFSVVLEPDREEPERYNVRVPALPGCLTYGEALEDALANAREAIAGYVESLMADGMPVPEETNPTIATTIVVTPIRHRVAQHTELTVAHPAMQSRFRASTEGGLGLRSLRRLFCG